MKRMITALALSALASTSFAADNTCLANKYDAYVDASMRWYQDLAQLTSEQYPELAEVSQWYLEGRQHHFALNAAAVKHYLEQDPNKVATERSVEGWLQLEQKDIKALAKRDDELGKIAEQTFADRQSKPHPKNYELRSALADLLSHPSKIDKALQRYNQSVSAIAQTECP
ncbi:hypothetical protein [Vibrio sp. LaRot3]|uniref:hypothetical protein n=1 Tax=Vibrio sp. LaRot3 TaxID=2998829 RepID=UPI0022CE1422|nr:hypothetical protein [Vibrio sp. LaRot3]MDA0147444.1 hypothetical protein [Vibrio sp. LaRot3]